MVHELSGDHKITLPYFIKLLKLIACEYEVHERS